MHARYVKLFASLWTTAGQASLSMGFSRQEYLTGLLCPSPGDLPNPGIGPTSLTSTCIGRWVLYHEHHLGSPWDIWFSLINNNLLMFRLPKTFEKFLLQKFKTFGVFLAKLCFQTSV